MENQEVREKAEQLKSVIDQANHLITELYKCKVETVIRFTNVFKNDPPILEILRLTEHRDYL